MIRGFADMRDCWMLDFVEMMRDFNALMKYFGDMVRDFNMILC